MDYEIRYADSGVAPEESETAVREWRPGVAALRLEISHEWPPRPATAGHQGRHQGGSGDGDPYAGYEAYTRYRAR
jgi:hypothetical protein